MIEEIIKTTFQFRRGRGAAWERNNPILLEGEPGYDIDARRFKVGDGISHWNELEYSQGKDGATPIKGLDYWTEVDKIEIINEINESKEYFGFSKQAINLLLHILSNAAYFSDQSSNIEKLIEILRKDAENEPDLPEIEKLGTPWIQLVIEEPVGPETPTDPEIPDEPDDPVVIKLDAPAIRLVTEGDEPDIPDEPDANTPAILGVAILGRTILGDYSGNVPDVPVIPKLATPVIRLVTVDDNAQKLVAPVIQLVTMPDPEDPEDPEEPDPVTPKLDAPAIRLETVTEPDLPIIPKLGTPTIHLETIVEPEPDEPEPEPEEPDVPVTPKLATPAIRLMDSKLAAPVIDIHDYSSTVVEPTCTEPGHTLHSCVCGDSYEDNIVDALGHDWGEPYKLGDEYVRDCARCGEQETGAEQYIRGSIEIWAEASGDTSFTSDMTLATRITRPDGRKMTTTHSERYPLTRVIELPLGEYTVSPREGYGWIDGYELSVKYTVQYGNSEPVETNTIVLTPEEHDPVVKAIYHYEKNDSEHVHSYTDAVTEPTCTTRGYTTYKCMCGDSYVDNYVNALGHDWSEPGDDGDEYVRVCERCGERPYASGSLNVSVVVDGDRTINDQAEYYVQMTRPDGKNMTAVLTPAIPETRLIDVSLGTYHFEALPEYSSADGYNLTVKYSVDYVVSDPIESQTATITSEVPTVNVTITYTYTPIKLSKPYISLKQQVVAKINYPYVEWDAIDGVDGYEVHLLHKSGGISFPYSTTTETRCHILDDLHLTYSCDLHIRVAPFVYDGDHKYYTNNMSEELHYAKLAKPRIQIDCDHDLGMRDIVTPPTCTKRGYTTHVCPTCGYSYDDSYVNSLGGHDWGPYTSYDNGLNVRECSVCKEVDKSGSLWGYLYVESDTDEDVKSLIKDKVITIKYKRQSNSGATSSRTMAPRDGTEFIMNDDLTTHYISEVDTSNVQLDGYDLTVKYMAGYEGEELFESNSLTLTEEKPKGRINITLYYTAIRD